MSRPTKVSEKIKEAVLQLGGQVTNKEIKTYIGAKYPGTSESVINDWINLCSVNLPSRVNYPSNQKSRKADGPNDFLFWVDRGLVELYDPATHGNWEIRLDPQGRPLVSELDFNPEEFVASIERIEQTLPSTFTGKEKLAIVKTRIGQSNLKRLLLKSRDKCALCGLNTPQLLVASHLKPWAKSDPGEKVNLANVFLLCPNHDKLLDRGLISFEDDGTLLISEALDAPSVELLNLKRDSRINLMEASIPFVRYHRKIVYIDSLS